MPKTVEQYIAMGCDRKTAEYYANGRKRIIHVLADDDFTLLLTFDNGEKRRFDLKPMLDKGGVFVKLRQIEHFRRVYLDDCNCVSWDLDPDVDSNIVWNNKVDLCADSCYIDSIPVA
ncbi:MAG: DUF2442 domain-containing protein [Clostridia bacterium]|nr:DUF2442 domain-containing protein [Clostridia bacterium]